MSQSPNPAAPQGVAPLLALATQFLKAGRPADAIAPLRDAAILQPSNAAILHDLGLSCLEVGRVPEAIAALQRAVTSNPRYADAYFRLGIALEKMGDMRGALSAYDRTLSCSRRSRKRGSAPARSHIRSAIATRRSDVFGARRRPEIGTTSAGWAKRGRC